MPATSRSLGDNNVIASGRPGPGLGIALASRSLDEGTNRLAVGGRVAEVQRQAPVLEPAVAERAEREWRGIVTRVGAPHPPPPPPAPPLRPPPPSPSPHRPPPA